MTTGCAFFLPNRFLINVKIINLENAQYQIKTKSEKCGENYRTFSCNLYKSKLADHLFFREFLLMFCNQCKDPQLDALLDDECRFLHHKTCNNQTHRCLIFQGIINFSSVCVHDHDCVIQAEFFFLGRTICRIQEIEASSCTSNHATVREVFLMNLIFQAYRNFWKCLCTCFSFMYSSPSCNRYRFNAIKLIN